MTTIEPVRYVERNDYAERLVYYCGSELDFNIVDIEESDNWFTIHIGEQYILLSLYDIERLQQKACMFIETFRGHKEISKEMVINNLINEITFHYVMIGMFGNGQGDIVFYNESTPVAYIQINSTFPGAVEVYQYTEEGADDTLLYSSTYRFNSA